MRHMWLAAGIAALFLVGPSDARAEITVITTDTNLADIAKQVGGDLVRVESLARGADDPHAVEPRPSMVVKLAHADVFARIGMDLDMFADAILERSGNRAIMKGGTGYADCSVRLKVLEAPTGKIDPSMGDIHVYGNPHYLLDPANGILAAGNIAAALIRVDPGNQPKYHARFTAFAGRIKDRLAVWQSAMAPYKGRTIAVYHKTWAYFMNRFGLKEGPAIEARPGLAPSPGHINDVVQDVRSNKIRALLVESFRSDRFPNLVSGQTEIRVAKVPISVDAEPGVDSYLKLFDTIVARLKAAMQ